MALQTLDRFGQKSEIDKTLKQDPSVKDSVSVNYDSSPWTITANADVAYQNSKSDASKLATDQAKDVVRRVSTKVTEQVRRRQTTKGFEHDVEFLIRSGGMIWGGAPMPDVHREDYLPIAEEIRDAQGSGDVGKPSDWWTVTSPTNQVVLHGDSTLSSSQVGEKWNWTDTPDPQA